MEEPGQRAGRRPARASEAGSGGARRRGAPSEEGLRRLIAAWASDVQTGVPAEEDDGAPALDGHLLQVVIGGGAFAFPLAAVTEVVPYVPPRRLPGQAAEAGVTMLRGDALPTLDAAACMGLEVDATAGRMVVLATREGPCAVVVSDTGEIVEVDPGQLAPPPAGAGASEYVVALVEIAGELVAVLDPERLCRVDARLAPAPGGLAGTRRPGRYCAVGPRPRRWVSMRRALIALTFVAVFWFPATASAAHAPTVVHVWRANLDGDAHIEHVRLMLRLEPNPFGGTLPIRQHWLEVVDRVGGRFVVARISPFVEHLLPRWVQVGDFNANGRSQVFYHGFDGGAGAVPLFAGIRGWTGTAKQRLWSYAPPFPVLVHNGHRYRYDIAEAALENLAAAGTPGLEVHLVQGEARPSEPDCCPSQTLTRNYRFDSGSDRWVLYQTVWRHT